MPYFEYSKSVKDIEYYEILENLMQRWEYEIVEFKEAKGGYDTDKIGRYFSAISNEANLRQQQYGWLIFGVGFKIPAAATGIPTDWKTNYYERAGESLVPLKQYKIDAIRSQERRDWSKQTLEQTTIDHLDKNAVALAREKYKEKMNQEHIPRTWMP